MEVINATLTQHFFCADQSGASLFQRDSVSLVCWSEYFPSARWSLLRLDDVMLSVRSHSHSVSPWVANGQICSQSQSRLRPPTPSQIHCADSHSVSLKLVFLPCWRNVWDVVKELHVQSRRPSPPHIPEETWQQKHRGKRSCLRNKERILTQTDVSLFISDGCSRNQLVRMCWNVVQSFGGRWFVIKPSECVSEILTGTAHFTFLTSFLSFHVLNSLPLIVIKDGGWVTPLWPPGGWRVPATCCAVCEIKKNKIKRFKKITSVWLLICILEMQWAPRATRRWQQWTRTSTL